MAAVMIIATVVDGIAYYERTRNGVAYCAYEARDGSWFVSSRRLALGKRHIGGGKWYGSLPEVEAGCKAFEGLGLLLAAAEAVAC